LLMDGVAGVLLKQVQTGQLYFVQIAIKLPCTVLIILLFPSAQALCLLVDIKTVLFAPRWCA
ncbi:hypothetical protein, partial [Streptomyces acidiscabies]|uniref:hypothetical protein n=1 Tax=Streptomyces acidiscabies TaxID=42234 RepID=UPI0038F6A1AE